MVGFLRKKELKMKIDNLFFRVFFSILTLVGYFCIFGKSFLKLTESNPAGYNWYLCNFIIQVVIWWGFSLYVFWGVKNVKQ